MSQELRRLIYYPIQVEMQERSKSYGSYRAFYEDWRSVARDLFVRFFEQDPDDFSNSVHSLDTLIKNTLYYEEYGRAFDLVEFILRRPELSYQAKVGIASAFVDARAAYRVVDGLVVAIGTAEQAVAFERALDDTSARADAAARKHLVDAAAALRTGDWAGSVRNSIHAVESVAIKLAPGEDTLGAALNAIDRRGHLHGGLKAAFSKLYGYSSDEAGVRHALVFTDEASVDEADALFMLGACSSFVSYLLARSA